MGLAPLDPPYNYKWLATLAVLVVLLAIRIMTLTPVGRPPWLNGLGKAVPTVFAVAGVMGARLFARRSVSAAAFALVAGFGMAVWIAWLSDHLLFDRDVGESLPNPPSFALSVSVFLISSIAIAFILYSGTDPFGLLAAAAFGYMGLSAVMNWGRLGLVAGIVVSLNLSMWVARLLPRAPDAGLRWGGWLGRLGAAFVLIGCVVAVVMGRYGGTVDRAFGLREKPLTYPHDAVRFAAQPDMPERALLYPADAASLYVYYHAPGHKPFVDPRMEVPLLETIRTYLAISKMLSEGDSRGVDAVDDLGADVVVLAHESRARAEVVLMVHPRWRLVYFDALAAVFLQRAGPQLEARFPTLNLGTQHFRQPQVRAVPDLPGAALKEATALYNLGLALRNVAPARRDQHLPALLAALARAEAAVEAEPNRAASWLLLARCHQAFLPEQLESAPTAGEGWVSETALNWARATCCLRRGLEAEPDNAKVLQALYRCYGARAMWDAQLAVGERLLALKKVIPAQATELRNLARALHSLQSSPSTTAHAMPVALIQFLETHQPEQAARLASERAAVLNWDLADRVAGA